MSRNTPTPLYMKCDIIYWNISSLRSVWASFNLFNMGLGLLLSIVISVIIGVRTLSTHQLLLSIMLAAFCTSNSFIIMEDQIALFLTQLLTSIIVLKNREKIQKKEFFLIGLQLIFSRISFTMRRCRPEQFWCYNSKYKNFLTKEKFLILKDFITLIFYQV